MDLMMSHISLYMLFHFRGVENITDKKLLVKKN